MVLLQILLKRNVRLLRELEMKTTRDIMLEMIEDFVPDENNRRLMIFLVDKLRSEEYERGREFGSGWEFETPCGIRLDLE
jgi:hypothetical protein